MPRAILPTGAELHYEDVGKGEIVVAVHGFLGTGRTDLGEIIDWLSKKYRVLAPTLRGYGESLPKPRTFSPHFYDEDAADVLAFITALDLPPVHLIGFSDGGEIGLIAGGTQPARFKSVAVWGAVGYFGQLVKAVAQSYIPHGAWFTDELQASHGIPDKTAFMQNWVDAISAMVDRGGDVSLHLAPQLTMPVLMMLGKQDTLNPVLYAERYLTKLARGQLALFDCGHSIHREAPDAFRQTLTQFWQEVG